MKFNIKEGSELDRMGKPRATPNKILPFLEAFLSFKLWWYSHKAPVVLKTKQRSNNKEIVDLQPKIQVCFLACFRNPQATTQFGLEASIRQPIGSSRSPRLLSLSTPWGAPSSGVNRGCGTPEHLSAIKMIKWSIKRLGITIYAKIT